MNSTGNLEMAAHLENSSLTLKTQRHAARNPVFKKLLVDALGLERFEFAINTTADDVKAKLTLVSSSLNAPLTPEEVDEEISLVDSRQDYGDADFTGFGDVGVSGGSGSGAGGTGRRGRGRKVDDPSDLYSDEEEYNAIYGQQQQRHTNQYEEDLGDSDSEQLAMPEIDQLDMLEASLEQGEARVRGKAIRKKRKRLPESDSESEDEIIGGTNNPNKKKKKKKTKRSKRTSDGSSKRKKRSKKDKDEEHGKKTKLSERYVSKEDDKSSDEDDDGSEDEFFARELRLQEH
ncbi:unnamed protein product [Ambrosiozyma monospora]|uniref:Unnamed protein product n=1 Tax=Ambrosiozyma monospora TaxID=43982 RepID=A0ACB5TP63_AMBMO|nr:unnamed protein product [Ambrosiozyma monospora]